jgi:hypothetical protein
MSVSFDTTAYTVSAQAGSVGITLDNEAGPATQVVLALGGGTAVPGVDYTPRTQTVSFAAGQSTQTVQVPVLPGSPSEGTRTLEIDLSGAPGAPPTSAAFVLITHNSDTTPPTVLATKALTKGPYVTGFVITFSKDMAPGPIQNVNNYAIGDPGSIRPVKGKEWAVTTRMIALKSAVYDSSTRSVTLMTAHKVKKYPLFEIMDRWLANELNLVGQKTPPSPAQLLPQLGPFTDTTGNPLSSAAAGTPGDGHLGATAAVGKAGNKLINQFNQSFGPGVGPTSGA